jgi:PAS domain S-box-containing protein
VEFVIWGGTIMTFSRIDRNIEVNPVRSLIAHFIILFIAAIAVSALVHNKWVQYLEVYHTVLELACIFIAVSIFFCIWYIFEWSTVSNNILGFGYLVVAIFDMLHTFCFLKLDLTAGSYFDLSTRYWILGRLAEAITMFLTINAFKVKGNKQIKLLITLTAAFGIAYFVVKFHGYLPVLLTEEGLTPAKVILEYVVISIYGYSLYKAQDKLKDKNTITYKYIFLSLLLSLSSELSFTMYSSVQSFIWTTGHVLKIIAYYYIFKGIIISCITFPYKRLEVERDNLEVANKELNEITETLNDIMDALPIGVQTYDDKGKVKYINKKYEELLKCYKKDVYGLSSEKLLERFPRLEKGEKNILYKTLESNEGPINSVRTYKNSIGDTIKLSLKSRKIRNGVLVLLNDANEEQKFDNLHIQTETILNAVNNGIMMIDKDRRVVLCNQAIAEILEISKSEIVGRNIDEFIAFKNFSLSKVDEICIDGDKTKKIYESCFVTVSGVKKELVSDISTVRNLYGEVIGEIIVSTDVTEANNRQKQILQQEKLALLGQMGAAIVHETRNYLTTIKGRCQLIELYADNERVKTHAAKINTDTEEVNRIISEFLFLSKPRETELTENSMHDIFESVKSMITTSSLVKGVDVEVNLCREERYLLCDESQIKQVILNLCKNAIEAMSEVIKPKLCIKTGFKEEANEMYISVLDNGKGISEEHLKRIGTPFFTTKGNGTGLGISVCHKIAKEHNGRLEVRSKLGEGTTFTLIIPCIEDEKIEDVI